jgi:hypothetical protein
VEVEQIHLALRGQEVLVAVMVVLTAVRQQPEVPILVAVVEVAVMILITGNQAAPVS